jgi:hypothetical protein
MFLLRMLFPRRFLWNGGTSPYNGERWRPLPYVEDGEGVWSFTDGEHNVCFFGAHP